MYTNCYEATLCGIDTYVLSIICGKCNNKVYTNCYEASLCGIDAYVLSIILNRLSKNHSNFRHHHHPTCNCKGCWGTSDDFTTSFLHFYLFSTALWDVANSRTVHSLIFSSHLFICLPCLLPPFTVPCKMVLARPDERET